MRFKCSACGREFDSGATIIGNVILCPDCARKLDEIVDECVADGIESYLETGKVNVRDCINRHKEDIEQLKLLIHTVRRIVLSRIFSTIRR